MKKLLLIIGFINIAVLGNAETLSLSTFYPSPYGVYSHLRLMPTDTAANPITCDDTNEGLMFYDDDAGEMVVCGDIASESLLVWRHTASGEIHLIETDSDIFVGIGDTGPDALVEVSASGMGNDLLMLSSVDANDGDIMRVRSNGHVGIGSRTPPYKLTIDQDRGAAADGGIVAFGTYGSGAALQASGAGTRMIWYAPKAAFRAGTVTGDHWDNLNVGDHSVALGFDLYAQGISSTAIGSNNNAGGDYAVAIGDFNGAMNPNGMSVGYSLVNAGDASVAMGKDNQINDPSTGVVVFGNNNQVIGDSSVVLGENSSSLFTVSSIAAGYNCGAYGLSSIAMGYNAQATESYSIALGHDTLADEILSVAMGTGSTANGFNSFAIGDTIETNGQYAAAFNTQTTAQPFMANVFGRFNTIAGTTDTWVDTEPIWIVGNGTGDLDRANALTVMKNGDTVIGGDDPEGYRLRIYGGDATVDVGNSWLKASDIRLKKDIVPLKGALDKIARIRGITYNTVLEPDDAPRHIGCIAQEVEKEFPELVAENTDGYKSVAYHTMTAVLVEAVKELKARNDRLRQELRALKKEFQHLSSF